LWWVEARKPMGGAVFLSHGEPDSLSALEARLVAVGFPASRIKIAGLDQGYVLKAGAMVEAAAGSRPRLPEAAIGRLDWHNARVAFLARLQHSLDDQADDEKREQLLRRLDGVLSGD
jgi:metallo-beta-lactamase family protein